MNKEKEDIHKILLAGHMAPSADNCQPWFFTFEKDTIFLHHDKKKSHQNHLYNIDYFADFVSLGGVLENMQICAQHLGYTSEIKVLSEKEKPIAAVKLKKTHEPYVSKTLEAISARKTNRKAYHALKVPSSISNEMLSITEKRNHRLYWIDGSDDIKTFSKIISIHDYILWEDPALRNNLIRMIRFGKKNHKEGLPLESLELGIKKHFFSISLRTAKEIGLLWKMLGLGSVMHHRKIIRKSAAICLLTSPQSHHKNTYIEGGRTLQSLWLYLTQNNVNLHPLFGTLSLIINERLARGGLSEKHRKIQNKVTKFFYKHFPSLKDETPVALFRVGYAQKPSAAAGRRNLQEVIRPNV